MSLCRVICACVALGGSAESALADEPWFYAPGGIALSGYDVVAYFTEQRAVEGDADYALSWRGATWYFAGPDTLMAFEMNPEAYAPQFGGYCAYAVAEGRTGPSEPEAFFLREGRLYFMNDARMLDEVEGDLAGIVAEAEEHWPAVLSE